MTTTASAEQPEEVDPVAADLHPGREGDGEDDGPHERRADMAATPNPAITAERSPPARNSRRVKPESKSAPIEKPMKTPPKAADCSSTKTNWKAS